LPPLAAAGVLSRSALRLRAADAGGPIGADMDQECPQSLGL